MSLKSINYVSSIAASQSAQWMTGRTASDACVPGYKARNNSERPGRRFSRHQTSGDLRGAVFLVRPAWARFWREKSSCELSAANEVKRNCARVTGRGEAA